MILPSSGMTDAVADRNVFLQLERKLELISHDWLREVRREPGAALAPFETDGCSGGMSDIWRLVAGVSDRFVQIHAAQPPWESCCVSHDHAYHLGGADPAPEQSYAARLAADETLRVCVSESFRIGTESVAEAYGLTAGELEVIYHNVADAMYLSVRLGGKPCSGLPWRWGYGWSQCGLITLP